MPSKFECYCFLIEALNGVKFGYTSSDRAITIDSIPYEPLGGLSPTATNQTAGLSIDNIRLEIQLDNLFIANDQRITPRYITSGALYNANATAALVDYLNPPITLRSGDVVFDGFVSEASLTNTSVNLELLARTTNLNKSIEENIGVTCRFQLGDSRCAANIVAQGYKVTKNISQIPTPTSTGYDIFFAPFVFPNPTRWVNGSIRVLTGKNAGMVFSITAVQGSAIAIESETPEDFQIGDQVEITAGCNKDLASCVFYNNALRFGGGIVGGNHFRSLSDVT